MAANIPSYPVVDVTVRDDGSAHVNIAGDHFDLPAGDVGETRRAIITHATDLAKQLGRPVRMRATDPTGTWLQAVHLDGTVTDMTPAPSKKRPKAKPARPQPSRPTTPRSIGITLPPVAPPRPVVPAPVIAQPPSTPPETTTRPAMPHTPPAAPLAPIDEATRFVVRTAPAAPRAVLRFSTGEVETITGAVIVGRAPVIPAGDDASSIAIGDPSRTLSKTHLRLALTTAGPTAVDLGSANGTFLVGEGAGTELTAGVPYPLENGASLELGTDVVVTISLAG